MAGPVSGPLAVGITSPLAIGITEALEDYGISGGGGPPPSFTPSSLFTSGQQGVWYDPSDFSTMFQDTAATVPVTEANQVVARINDKSGRANNALQDTASRRPILRGTPNPASNIVTNGTFDTNLAGWTTTVAVWDAGAMRFQNVNGSAWQACPGAAGRVYKVTWTQTILGGTRQRLRIRNFANTADIAPFTYWVGSGTFFVYTTSTDAGVRLEFTGEVADDFTIDNVTIEDATADVVSAPFFLQFDGVDDRLEVASFDAASDEVEIVAGATEVPDSNSSTIVGYNGAGNGSCSLANGFTVGFDRGQMASRGTTQRTAIVTGITTGDVFVVGGSAKVSGPFVTGYLDGVEIATTTTNQGTGDYGPGVMFVGARGDGFLTLAGELYQLVIRFQNFTAQERLDTDEYVASKSGVTL